MIKEKSLVFFAWACENQFMKKQLILLHTYFYLILVADYVIYYLIVIKKTGYKTKHENLIAL